MRILLICMLCAATVLAQYDSPIPQRFQIPGAIPLGVTRQGGFRQARIKTVPYAPRILRPSRPSFKSVELAPRPNIQLVEDQPKPVTEEPENELLEINTPTGFTPISYSTPEPQNDYYDITTTSQPKPPIAFNPQFFQQATPTTFKPEPAPVRPTPYRPQIQQQYPPIRNEVPIKQQQPARLQPLSSRPTRPTFRPEARPFDDEPVQPVRQYTRPEPTRPAPQRSQPAEKYIASNPKEKKPVAQIIKKYREENEDGSITWGFENDDGSFKEETIGIDCITRGRYGYVDPDGLKREYNYETGILCDRSKEDQEEEKGYVDYQENKAVLPNGIKIDLANMGKKSKRPFRSPTNH